MSTNFNKGFNNLPSALKHAAGDFEGGMWPSKFHIIFDDFNNFNTNNNGFLVGTTGNSSATVVNDAEGGVLELNSGSAANDVVLKWGGGAGANRSTMNIHPNGYWFHQVRYKLDSANTGDFNFAICSQTSAHATGATSPGNTATFAATGAFGTFGTEGYYQEASTKGKWITWTTWYDPKEEFIYKDVNGISAGKPNSPEALKYSLSTKGITAQQNPTSNGGAVVYPFVGWNPAGNNQKVQIDYVMMGYERQEGEY
jgi:hypothetical protein